MTFIFSVIAFLHNLDEKLVLPSRVLLLSELLSSMKLDMSSNWSHDCKSNSCMLFIYSSPRILPTPLVSNTLLMGWFFRVLFHGLALVLLMSSLELLVGGFMGFLGCLSCGITSWGFHQQSLP